MGELFDPDEIFGEDYLYFAAGSLDPDRDDEDAEIAFVRAGLAPGARVLDAPCGHGRISLRLAQRGVSVFGVDRSADYLELARLAASAGGIDATFVQGDLRRLPVDGPFDAVLCWFTSFGYFDDAENLAVLREFRRVLSPGGVLLVETLSHDGYVRSFTESPEAIVVDVDGDLMVDRSTFDVVTGRVRCHRVTLRNGVHRAADFSLRLLTVPEWHDVLGHAGFRHVEVTDREGLPPDLSSWRIVVRAGGLGHLGADASGDSPPREGHEHHEHRAGDRHGEERNGGAGLEQRAGEQRRDGHRSGLSRREQPLATTHLPRVRTLGEDRLCRWERERRADRLEAAEAEQQVHRTEQWVHGAEGAHVDDADDGHHPAVRMVGEPPSRPEADDVGEREQGPGEAELERRGALEVHEQRPARLVGADNETDGDRDADGTEEPRVERDLPDGLAADVTRPEVAAQDGQCGERRRGRGEAEHVGHGVHAHEGTKQRSHGRAAQLRGVDARRGSSALGVRDDERDRRERRDLDAARGATLDESHPAIGEWCEGQQEPKARERVEAEARDEDGASAVPVRQTSSQVLQQHARDEVRGHDDAGHRRCRSLLPQVQRQQRQHRRRAEPLEEDDHHESRHERGSARLPVHSADRRAGTIARMSAATVVLPRDARRIVVRGTSGSGKTTLARAISESLGIPHVELDGIFQQPDWTPMPDEKFVAKVRAVATTESWVICGNYRQVAPFILERADTVVLYDLSRPLVMWRVITRTVSRALRNEELWNGNHEGWRNIASFDPQTSIVAWAWTTHERRHQATLEMLANPPRADLRMVHLTSARDERQLYRALEGRSSTATRPASH
jgi:SAM-dependent methyltransferase/adenylate kinase family enzyme